MKLSRCWMKEGPRYCPYWEEGNEDKQRRAKREGAKRTVQVSKAR